MYVWRFLHILTVLALSFMFLLIDDVLSQYNSEFDLVIIFPRIYPNWAWKKDITDTAISESWYLRNCWPSLLKLSIIDLHIESESEGRFRTGLHIEKNIYQLTRFSRACDSYYAFCDNRRLLNRKLLNQRLILVKLTSSLWNETKAL
jgi:hypothetical protein